MDKSMKLFNRDISSQTIIINGIQYDVNNIDNAIDNNNGQDIRFIEEIVSFIKDWFDNTKTILVHSSGSTGTPKPLYVEKEKMMNSAIMTCEFLGLKSNDKALLCMPMKYIAGKMVIVRALVANLNIIPITPCGRPLERIDESIEFAAMIPMQIFNSLNDEHDSKILSQIRDVIIGGGSVDKTITDKIENFPNNLWSTYGMTETLSHIALRKLNGILRSEWYTPLKNIRISHSKEMTLCIDAPELCQEFLVTNDICEIDSYGNFKIIGRRDNTINSGGIKIQIEEIEDILKEKTNAKFIITSAKDIKLGDKMVMLIEKGQDLSIVIEACNKYLSPYKRPKEYIEIEQLPLTETGKPDRAKAKEIAKQKNSLQYYLMTTISLFFITIGLFHIIS